MPASVSLFPAAADCINSYTQEVAKLYSAFFERAGNSETEWIENATSRSPLDNFLFEVFYEEAGTSPITDFHFFYETALQRTWYEKAERNYSEDMFEVLYQLLIPLAYDGVSLYTEPKYVELAPLHEAFALNAEFNFL